MNWTRAAEISQVVGVVGTGISSVVGYWPVLKTGAFVSLPGLVLLFIVLAIVSTGVLHLTRRPLIAQHVSHGQELTPIAGSRFAAVEDFYRTYDNAMLVETESAMRIEANKYQSGNDRERFLLRQLSATAVIALFEQVWYTIFRSQTIALQFLNSTPIDIDS